MLALLLVLFSANVLEERAQIRLDAGGEAEWKRFVLRYPEDPDAWNGRLVIGAHGGSGGENFSRDGRVTGTDETALDDVVGDYAVAHGFAYASVDRDGIGGTREGLDLTVAFAERMSSRLADRLGRRVEKAYLAGLSMGGGIARYAAEHPASLFDGILIIVGAHGDAPARRERSKKMAELWPRIDDVGPEVYAAAVGTPVDAARFWPFMGRSTSARRDTDDGAERENTTGAVAVPTIEIAGTFDDFVYPEVLVYRDKVEQQGASERYRLYRVEGAWHISPEDDAIGSFQFIGSRMGLSEETLDAMATGASYLPAVQESLMLLDAWVSHGTPPPADRLLTEDQTLLP